MVSAGNKATIEMMRHKTLSSTNVTLGFIVFDFDPTVNPGVYYTAMGMNQISPTGGPAMTGLLAKESNKLAFEINLREDTTIKNPKNFEFKVGVMPDKAQAVFFATASGNMNVAKPWGITVGAASG